MEDECVEELGRPISSLKVIELRDELTRRALIKTGNKKELIDRLRAAIQRQTSQAGSTDGSAQQQPPQLQHQHQQSLNADEQAILETNQRASLDPQQANTIDPGEQQLAEPAQPSQRIEAFQEPANDAAIYAEQLQATDLSQSAPASASRAPDARPSDLSPTKDNIDQQEQPQQEPSDLSLDKYEEDAAQSQSCTDTDTKQTSDDSQRESQTDQQEYPSQQEAADESPLKPTLSGKVEQSIEQSSQSVANSASESSAEINSAQNTFSLKRGITETRLPLLVGKQKKRKWSTKPEVAEKNEDTANQESLETSTREESVSQRTQELVEEKLIEVGNKVDSQKTLDSITDIGSKLSTEVDSKTETEIDTSKAKDSQTSVSTEANESVEATETSKLNLTLEENQNTNKKQSVDDESIQKIEERSQPEPEQDPTNTLLILNLVRPFTVMQLKGVLTKYGPIKEDKFWTDKVKSKCCVVYESIEVAQQIRDSLHGQQWPSSNPKTLSISYVNEEIFLQCQSSELSKEPQAVAKGSENGDPKKDQQTSKSIISRLGDRQDATSDGSNVETVKKRLGERALDGANTKLCNPTRDSGSATPKKLDDLFRKTKTVPHLFWKPCPDSEERSSRQLNKSLSERLGERQSDGGEVERSEPVKRPPSNKTPGDNSTKQINLDKESEIMRTRDLDDLFRKTNSVPHIFWLPLTDAEADVRRKARQERSARLHREERNYRN